MSDVLAAYHRRQSALKRAAFLLASCELGIDVTGKSVADLMEAESQLAVAARLYVEAIDALPLERKRQIKGWEEM